MAIKIEYDRICFGNFIFCENATGIVFDGCACATEFRKGSGFQGIVSGYTSGGSPPGDTNIIDKFPFAADNNATDVGDLTQSRTGAAGQSSTVSGYSSGGNSFPTPSATPFNTIDKFPFTADNNATDVGELSQSRTNAAGQSSSESGYSSGGLVGSQPGGPYTTCNTIDNYPFASDTPATDVGDLTHTKYRAAGQSSSESGYASGGSCFTAPQSQTPVNTINKFPFASDTNATDVGDLTQARTISSGQSSTVSGYAAGGSPGPGRTNTIDKFPFAADGNASDVGDLTQSRSGVAGQSSTVSGYASGGSPPGSTNIIDKFPFAADNNATDVGDLTQSRSSAAGQQV